mmetsp:Transcript_88488/g.246278  ORF Transcript_88488/g.246278 Transcript_88488/m.246278 type:complete len:217 (-) Transcript_88488:27-677(-)
MTGTSHRRIHLGVSLRLPRADRGAPAALRVAGCPAMLRDEAFIRAAVGPSTAGEAGALVRAFHHRLHRARVRRCHGRGRLGILIAQRHYQRLRVIRLLRGFLRRCRWRRGGRRGRLGRGRRFGLSGRGRLAGRGRGVRLGLGGGLGHRRPGLRLLGRRRLAGCCRALLAGGRLLLRLGRVRENRVGNGCRRRFLASPATHGARQAVRLPAYGCSDR